MGRFNISLPNDITCEVNCGKVFKIEVRLLNLFMPWKKFDTASKTAYIVKVNPAMENITELRFYKNKEGHWYHDAEGTLEVEGNLALSIRKAIEKHEHSLT